MRVDPFATASKTSRAQPPSSAAARFAATAWTHVLVPRTNDRGQEVDMRRRMQPQQLKSLVESGHYKPEPALVAEAMLRRRGVRELLIDRADCRSASWSNPSGLQQPAAGQPDLDPRAGDRPRRSASGRVARRPPSAAAASLEPLGGQRREQLVVLAAGERPAASGSRAGRRGDLGDAVGRAAGRRRRSAARPPLASARRRASPPSPSLRSIIAVAPAARQQPARPRAGAGARAGATRAGRDPPVECAVV